MKKLTGKEIAKFSLNILSPRSYNYTKLKSKNGEGLIEIEPIMHVRDEALLDLIFDKFIKQNNFKILEEGYGDEEIWAERFNTLVKRRNSGEPPIYNCIVELDSREIRKALGLPRFTDKEIEKRATNLNKILIKAIDVRIWAMNDGTYRTAVTWEGNIIRDRWAEDTDRIAPKTKNIQHRFFFTLEDATVMLWANDALNRRLSLFPKKYYSFPHKCQQLLRYLSLWSKSHFDLGQMADILNWRGTFHTPTKKKQVENILERLKKEGYITNWERVKNTRGLKTTWFIHGINTIRKDEPKALEEAEVVKTEDIEEAIERDNIIEAELVN